jgi:hypothetical protein
MELLHGYEKIMLLTAVIAILHANKLLSQLQRNLNNIVDFLKYNVLSSTAFFHFCFFASPQNSDNKCPIGSGYAHTKINGFYVYEDSVA